MNEFVKTRSKSAGFPSPSLRDANTIRARRLGINANKAADTVRDDALGTLWSDGRVASLILDALSESRYLTRSFLEEMAEEEGHQPSSFTRELRELRNNKDVYCCQIKSPVNGSTTDVYSLRILTATDVIDCQRRIKARHLFLNAQAMRANGERYARSLLRRARDDGNQVLLHVPNRRRLGNFRLGDDYRADLIVDICLGSTKSRAIVECKNARERFDLNSELFSKLLCAAVEYEAIPVLVTAHISERAESFCESIGIALLHLEKQVIPSKRRFKARRLWTKRRAERIFHAVRLDRPFAYPIDETTARHLKIVSDPQWLLNAAITWNTKRTTIPSVVRLLKECRYNQALQCVT